MKCFPLQFNFLRPSPYDLRSEENNAQFLPINIKQSHHFTYQNFLLYSTRNILRHSHSVLNTLNVTRNRKESFENINQKNFLFVSSKMTTPVDHSPFHKNIPFWVRTFYYKIIFLKITLMQYLQFKNLSLNRRGDFWRLSNIVLSLLEKKDIRTINCYFLFNTWLFILRIESQ